jgi:hypothetical protein
VAKFVYIGEPTAGKTTKDIKLPKENGSFDIIQEVIPNVTEIVTEDDKSIDFLNKNKKFEQK